MMLGLDAFLPRSSLLAARSATEFAACYLSSPQPSIRASLAMQYACNICKQEAGLAGHVGQAASPCWILFVCSRLKLESCPPCEPAEDKQYLPQVQIKYISTLSQLHQLVSCLPMLESLPAAVVVDGMSDFASSSTDKHTHDVQLIKALALLVDTTEHISKQRGTCCPLLVTNSASNTTEPEPLYLYQRWLPMVVTVADDAWWPLFLATMSGLSTSVGAALAVIKTPSQAMLAGLLGSAIGVMFTVSVVELVIRNAMESDVFLVLCSSTGGGLAYYLVEPFFPKMEEPGLIVGVDSHAHKREPPLLVHLGSKGDSFEIGDSKMDMRGTATSDLESGHSLKPLTVSRKNGILERGEGLLLRKSASAEGHHGEHDSDCERSPTMLGAAEGFHTLLEPGSHAQDSPRSSSSSGTVEDSGQRASTAHLLRLGMLMAFTMTLHNLPEGFAVAFSAYTDFGPIMALAIAVHNIPEGIIVAAPIFAATGDRWKALGVATASGLSEPLGAVLALAIFKPFISEMRLHIMLAFVGGIMLAVCVIELWPEGRACRHDGALAYGIIIGAAVMGWTLFIETRF